VNPATQGAVTLSSSPIRASIVAKRQLQTLLIYENIASLPFDSGCALAIFFYGTSYVGLHLLIWTF